jgi:two-component sensor histidine kinase/ABC-type amino acid transport substrate-binding protein
MLADRRALAALALLLLARLSAPDAGGQPGPAGALAEPGRTIIVATDDDYPPYSFKDKAGRLEGIVPDQWAAWSRATGVKVELRALPWAEDLDALDRGEIDVLDTAFETPERRQRYDFTPAYATIEVPVFIHKSISGISSPADLRGFRVAVKKGDEAVNRLAAEGVTYVSLYADYKDIIDDAVALKTRIFCVDKPPALYYLYERRIDRDFRIAFTLYEGTFHRAVLKGRAGTLALVNEGFRAVPKSTLDAIDRKWLGAPLSSIVDMRLVFLLIAAAALLFLALMAITEALRRRVASATRELRENVDELEANREQLRASLTEKETLLKEIHHRVKNNMQVISSLIALQADVYRDEEDKVLATEIQARIRSMAAIHELLYGSPRLDSIAAAEYLSALSSELAASYGRSPPLLDCDESVRLSLDEAFPFGLIAHELISNALKYAYPGGARGEIRVNLHRDALGASLLVADAGAGLPPGLDPQNAKTMGFFLVRSLADQLGARLTFSSGGGFSAELRFPHR